MNKKTVALACRVVLVIAAVALLAVPMMIVMATGKGFSADTARFLTSGSLVCWLGAVVCSTHWQNKSKNYTRLIVGIALFLVLLNQWI